MKKQTNKERKYVLLSPNGSKDACSPTQPLRFGCASKNGTAADLAIIVHFAVVDAHTGLTVDVPVKADVDREELATKPIIFRQGNLLFFCCFGQAKCGTQLLNCSRRQHTLPLVRTKHCSQQYLRGRQRAFIVTWGRKTQVKSREA